MVRPRGLSRLRDIVFLFDPAVAAHAIGRWLTAAPARPDDGYARTELERHLRFDYSTFTWVLEPMIERCGFSIREAHDNEAGLLRADYPCERAISASR